MLQVSKNVTYSGESSIDTEAGAHITLATMSAVISDSNLLSISKNITYGSAYTMYKDIIEEDWKEFEDEIDEVVEHAASGESDWEKLIAAADTAAETAAEEDREDNDDSTLGAEGVTEDSGED